MNNLYKYASPANLYRLARRIIPWLAILASIFFVAGLYVVFVFAPTDFQQGDVYRVLFIHVPASWIGMLFYLLMAIYAAIGWAWNARASSMMASSLSNTGALFTVLSLITGSLWAKPTWGTWWVWDARTTSTLILLFLYVGFISLQSSIDDPRRADRASAVLALVGVINVPIIYFSVQWWNTLHQGATIRILSRPTMAPPMLAALLILSAAFWLYSVAAVLSPAMLHHQRTRTAGGSPMNHAFYVWGAYGLALAAMCGEVLALVRRRRALLRQKSSGGTPRS